MALALRQAGADVHLFSGARRPASRAYELRRETHDGIPITSLNTEPFLAFDDPHNYDNPPADEALLAWLDQVAPDVVHAHSLQGLGAGWLEGAAARAPVVVTMHDWWWICARQFLVDSDLQADGPLVDGGTCECSGGVEFNRRRRAWLAGRLAHTDRVLVPSPALRDSLAANGYRVERITVDPNGVVTPAREAARAPADSGTPHLGFVGGWHEFKGLPTLLAARRALPDDPLPFRLTCWGAADAPETENLPPGVSLLPAYAPGDAAAVMGGLDALAVPSIMRESFSLVTAEALAAGIPVLCSDSGGPEELVRHGVNGLVVESASVPAWRQTLARWSADPDLRQRLRAGAARGLPTLVDPDGQAAHLAEVYSEVRQVRGKGPVLVGVAPAEPGLQARHGGRSSAAPSSTAATPMPGLLLLTGIEGAPLRYRGHNLLQAHRALGGATRAMHYRDPAVPGAIPPAGIVVFYRVPWSSWVRQCVEATLDAGATPVFSVDDLVFDPSLHDQIPALRALPAGEAELWMEGVRRYQMTAEACGVFIGSTPALVRAAEAQGWQAHLWANHLGAETALLSQAALRDSQSARAEREAAGTCRIGYLSGTTSHDADWAVAEAGVAAVLEGHPGAELWLVGHLEPGGALAAKHPRVRRIDFRPFQELPRLMADLDIVLAPLEPDLAFSEAKSAIKWVEAAAMGLPVVASPTEPFRAVVEDGVDGLLASAGDWNDTVARLVEDPDLRRRIGLAARRAVYRDHGPWSGVRAWSEILPGLERDSRALPAGHPVEGPTPWDLEPEAPTGYLDRPPVNAESLTPALGGDARSVTHLHPRYTRIGRADIQAAGGRPGAPPLRLELRSGGRLLVGGEVDAERLSDGGWTAWEFDPVEVGPGVELRLDVSQPGAAAGRGARLWQDPEGVSMRLWATPKRDEISAVATGRPPQTRARARPGTGARRLRVLWFKGRASLRSAGPRATAFRVFRVGQREVRGALRRLQSRSRNRR
ncbi:MAG: hypothetical protein QOK05_2080 [Chloroflexota bacterium]|nr:hypothetical protein [Chloroflexota bacterium]